MGRVVFCIRAELLKSYERYKRAEKRMRECVKLSVVRASYNFVVFVLTSSTESSPI